ncbi:uncharacterized protein LOC111684692 [Lucilia cuprina]|uniref:uncharacterized protein LOC111684692 n=1 Tax=Lucilia cuprina TaxID=7375 RepID=UPI001F068FB4|nr:uncharacterized protein LOC111684692 [Lucilia cuprina]
MAMLWMETYFLYCSVRLGVMVISILAFISLFVPSILFFAMGAAVLGPTLKLFTDDENFSKHPIVLAFTDKVENDANKLMVLFQLYFFAHMTASVLAFYGALKLKKYFLLPLIFFEFCRVIYCLACHILLMTVSKSRLNLGMLITTTLAGGFLILFLGYNWATCVALYQIITLINSERYKTLYGDDPFKPLIPKTYNPMVNENVHVLITPNSNDIDEQKKRNAFRNAANRKRQPQPQPIISVLPIDYLENNFNSNRNNVKWKESQWPTTTVQTPPESQRYPPPSGYNPSQRRNENNFRVNYNNWQWSELAPAVSARNKKNIYMGSRWYY